MMPVSYHIRSLTSRPATVGATVGGIALVVATLVGSLALAEGFRHALATTGSDENVIVLRGGANSEAPSGLPREAAGIVASLPQLATRADGAPLMTAESYVVISAPRADGTEANVPVRGVDPRTVFQVRGDVTVTEGRMFSPGAPEVVTGRAIARRVPGLAVGDTLLLSRQPFVVVGHFSANGSAFESEVWGENQALMEIFRGPIYQSITFRLADPGAFGAARETLLRDPRLEVDVFRERAFHESQSETISTLLRALAFFITAVMGIGAIFGAVNTMDALVAQRRREIGLLFTLGFRPPAVLGSFLLEAVLIALAGGLIGCLLALPLNGMGASTTNFQSFAETAFQLRITPGILLQGLGAALILGALGGLLPAWHASRRPAAASLRA